MGYYFLQKREPLNNAIKVPALWDFCEKLYAEPDIELLCLHLQDEQNVNVLILLWCTWLEVRGEKLTAGKFAMASGRITAASESAVVPLREARRLMKVQKPLPPAVMAEVRDHILRAELLAEKCLLLELETLNTGDKIDFPECDTLLPLDRLIADTHLQDSEVWLSTLRAAANRVTSPA